MPVPSRGSLLSRRSLLGGACGLALAAGAGGSPSSVALVGAASPARSISARSITVGAALPEGLSPDAVRAHGRLVGARPRVVSTYVAWSSTQPYPAAEVRALARDGVSVEIVWEPWDPAAGVEQPAFSHAAILRGDHDDYLRGSAQAILAGGVPVYLRLMHEANGSWYPWAAGVNGNSAESYRAAWRHVRDLVRGVLGERAGLVSWVWTPNVDFPGATPLADLWPGGDVVDVVGVDGYNFGTSQPWSRWGSFRDVVLPSIDALHALTGRSVFVCETACTEAGGDKAAWMRDMAAVVRATPHIAGYSWFDLAKETDWRVDSSAASLAAFRRYLAASS